MPRPYSLIPLTISALAGCAGGEPSTSGDAPTWHQDIAPIVIESCAGCHAEGGIGPFPLTTYEQARSFAPAIASAVERGTMPPFLAQDTEDCTPTLPWLHDLRLGDAQKDLIARWADAGAPEGDPASAAPVQSPSPAVLPREDVVLSLPEPIEVQGDRDMHTCVVLDPGLAEDSFITGRLITSGNEAVLHHVVSYAVVPGEGQTKADLEAAILAEKGVGIGGRYDCFGGINLSTVGTEIIDAWAPGGLPNLAPASSGQPFSKEALVVLDIHYHPAASLEIDSATRLSLMLADEAPELVSQTILLGNFDGHYEDYYGTADLMQQTGESEPAFLIPAGESGHVEEMTWKWALPPGFSISVYGMGTHMHYVGRDMKVTLERAAGEPAEECLIQTPAWDFNWQRGYQYDAPYEQLPAMKDGDVLRMRCVFDNTESNPFLVDALDEQGLDSPVDVFLGEDTLDEMCLAAVSIIYPNF